MRAFAKVAERFGGIDPKDESQVQRFFEDEAPALPQTEQAEILDALLEFEGTAPAPLKDRAPASGPSEILLEDSPPLPPLPEDQQTSLAAWMATRDRAHWDEQLASDFSPGGRGMSWLHRVKDQVRKGRSRPLSKGKRRR
jgi:hypothetical protein